MLWLVLLPALSVSVRADDQPTTRADATQPASSPAPDKSAYTLFHPVSADQLREMDTDRPNVTNTPHTIDAGHLQIETGLLDYAYHRQRVNGVTTRQDDSGFALTNFRLGLLNNLEVNVAIDPYQIDRTRDVATGLTSRSHGFGDLFFGFKLNAWGNEGSDDVGATALAIQPQLSFPTAGDGVGSGRFEGSLNFPFLVNLPASFHLGLQSSVFYERSAASTGYLPGFQQSVSLDRQVAGKLDLYVEYAAHVTAEKHRKAVHSIDVGGTYPLTDNLSLDAGVNFGLNSATTTIEVLVGISVRL